MSPVRVRQRQPSPRHVQKEIRNNIFLQLISFFLGAMSCLVAVSAIYISFFSPELRCEFGFDDCTRFQTITLVGITDVRQIEVYNLGLKEGVNILDNIPYETGWKATTQCHDRKELPESMSIMLREGVSLPIEAYLLIQAGWGIKQHLGKPIGNVIFLFDNGAQLDIQLVLGENIRDWAEDDPIAVTTEKSEMLEVVYKGYDSNLKKYGHIDRLLITFPKEFHRLTITKIILLDTSTNNVGSLDPCLHLLGLTIKKIAPN